MKISTGLKKTSLKHGTFVRNERTGSIGEVRGLSGKTEILGCRDEYVHVRVRIKAGKTRGRYYHTSWEIDHLTVVENPKS